MVGHADGSFSLFFLSPFVERDSSNLMGARTSPFREFFFEQGFFPFFSLRTFFPAKRILIFFL